MTENLSRSVAFRQCSYLRSGFVPAVCAICCALALGACAERKRPNIPWATATKVRPVAPPASAASVALVEPPDLGLVLPALSSHLITVRTPPRPRGASQAVTNGANDADKLTAPLLAPQLSAKESAAAQQETNQNLSEAEKNLQAAAGRKLNATQADLVSKIKGFVKDAREAAETGDWALARNLSKKAQLLSDDLVSSF